MKWATPCEIHTILWKIYCKHSSGGVWFSNGLAYWTTLVPFSLQDYDDPINHVTDFKYLGSNMAPASSDLKRSKAWAWSAFWKLERLWKGSQLSISAKVKLFYTTCVTIFLYGCESWVLSLDMENKINAFATSCYRIMLGIKWQDCISNIAIYSMTNTEPLVYYVRKRQPGFLGHILCLPEEGPARRYTFSVPPHGKRKPGHPRTSYITYIQWVLGYHEVDISADEIATLAEDRRAWRNLVMACSAAEGW